MGRKYIARFNAVAVSAQQDFFEINAPSDVALIIHHIHLSQSTEVGDAAEEVLNVIWKSGATTSGSGGNPGTAQPLEFGDAAFAGSTEVNNTTKATAGTIVTHAVWNWNVRMPFDVMFMHETRLILSPGRRGTLELATTPVDPITCSGYLMFEELGG